MMTGTIVVSMIALTGWLYLNWRALQAHQLSFEQKAGMGVGWVLIFAFLAFILSRLGF